MMKAVETRSSNNRKRSKMLVMTAFALALVSTCAAGGDGSEPPKVKDNNPAHKPDIRKMNGQVSPWPKYGEKPDTDTPEVKAWVKEVDWSKVPKLPVRQVKSPGDPPECPEHVSEKDCWWTCTGCFDPEDVVECPDKNSWGLTFDDGPEPGVTENLLALLKEKNVTATMFVTGMKSSKGPWLLKDILDHGHHLASHSWSHSGMTTLTNEEIVAELKWTEKYIFDHTGYRIKYFRPPYGDIDNRVRAIAKQLGYRVVIWSDGWDSQDWQLPEHTITSNKIVKLWKDELGEVHDRDKGVVTLEHDGDARMIIVARTLLDMGIKRGLKPQDIAQCIHDPKGYHEIPKASLPQSPATPPKAPEPAAPPKKPEAPVEDVKEPEKKKEHGSEAGNAPTKSGSEKSSVSMAGLMAAAWTLSALVMSLAL